MEQVASGPDSVQVILSAARCPVANDADGGWNGTGFGWSRVLSGGKPGLVAEGGLVLGGQRTAVAR
jgi:hypothetical protein